jgi:hypothetical protein
MASMTDTAVAHVRADEPGRAMSIQRRASGRNFDSLQIVTWNCGGGLHRKLDHPLALEPDLAIVQEACLPERL